MSTSKLLLASLLLALSARGETVLEKLNAEVTGLFESNKHAVVKVFAERQTVVSGFPLRPAQRVGTGFFIDAEGRLLTSASVIEGATSCWVSYREQKLPLTVLGLDSASKVAVLKISTNLPVPFVKLGDSDTLQTGALVVTVGFPYELPSAPVVGFVSGFDVQHGFHQFVTPHIRTDCRLSPGQAGAPVFDAQGKVVGIAVAARADNQCYALPINATRKIVADIVKHGSVRFGWVGLAVAERTATGRTNVEVVVQQIYSNSPAAAIGFRANDVLVRIGTNQVRRTRDVLNAMFDCRPGEQISIAVKRENLEQQFNLVVGERPDQQPATAPRLPPMLPVSGTK
jgi:serine protease Do